MPFCLVGGEVSYIIEVPVEGGGRLLVEADDWQLSDELELAATTPGEVACRARESLEHSFDQLRPAVASVIQRLRTMSPDEFTVEFGLTFGAECGLVVAKGSSEVHFAVTLSWRRDTHNESAIQDAHG